MQPSESERQNWEINSDREFISAVMRQVGATTREETLQKLHFKNVPAMAATGANAKQIGGEHYVAAVQHWDIIDNHDVGYLEGCASKYVTRARKKNGLQDLQKFDHYVEKLIENCASRKRRPRGSVPLPDVLEFIMANRLTALEGAIVFLLLTWSSVAHLKKARELGALLRETLYPQAPA